MNELAKRPMIYKEARECADQINANLTNLRALVVDLHDRKGWLALGYANWTECVQKEFRQAARYIFYQYKAAEIEQNVSDCTKVQLGTIPETHLRPLAKLPPDQQREAWSQAVATAPDGRVTAAIVCNVVKSIMVGQEKPSPAPQPQMPPDAIKFVENAIGQLQRITSCDPRREEGLGKLKQWLKDNTAQSEPKIRPRKCKIAALRRKQRWLLNNQIPIDMTPVG
jgi:hypothetical protein